MKKHVVTKNEIKQILFEKFVHKEKCDKEEYKWFCHQKFLHIFLRNVNGWGLLQAAFCNMPMFFFVFVFLNDLAVIIIYEPQNYRPYLGLRNMYILSTFDQDISLNWEYYPEQCPILLSTVYWDNGAGCKVNDTRVQSCISFI